MGKHCRKKLKTTVEELQSSQEVYGKELPSAGTSIRFMYFRTGDGRMRERIDEHGTILSHLEE